MSAVLDLRPDTGHPVVCGVAEVHGLLDSIHAGTDTQLASGEHAVVVSEVDRAIRRLEAVKLKLLAAADKAGVAQDAGFTGTDAWTARQTTVSRARAARDVRLATDLDSGHDTTAGALAQGLLSPGHAAVIMQAARELPTGLSEEQRATVEAALVAKARRYTPEQLRREARRALAAVEPDQRVVDAHENVLVRTDEDLARARCALTLHDNGDGTTTGHFTIPALAAAILGKIIDAMTAPRRMRSDSPSSLTGSSFDWRHRRGLAFAELLEHLPTDHLHTRTTATVVVTLDHTVLTDALRTARLDTGETISAGEARRLACGAGILPAVLGTDTVPLDLGRETRLFTRHQALALGLRHHTCAAEHCQRPYAWCELHHRDPWTTGGPTDLDNAEPLCHYHHQRIHDHTYTHHRQPDGTIRFRRRGC